jgi:catechol 1,2-dioxygenase
VQFAVTQALVGPYVRHENETAPAPDISGPWYSLEHAGIEAGEARLPRPPITGKSVVERPELEILARSPEPTAR